MKARCPHCGWTVALTTLPEQETQILCTDCGRSFDPEPHLMFRFGETHVSQQVESFVVEWQLRG
jgi:NAD-dependent SIR2 family protein deacetylase